MGQRKRTGVSEGWSVELGYWLVSLLLQCDWRRLGKKSSHLSADIQGISIISLLIISMPFPAACSFLRSIIGGAISAHRFHRDWVMDHFVIWWMLKCTSPNFSWAFCYWELGLCQGVLLKVSEWPRKQFITFETTGFLYINSSQICVYFNHLVMRCWTLRLTFSHLSPD